MLETGRPPGRENVFLDLRSLGQVFDHSAEDLTVRLSTGFTVKELNSKLSKKGQRLGIDIPGSAKATGKSGLSCAGPSPTSYLTSYAVTWTGS